MILAHAFGARYDLPIPLLLFVVGGGVVVIVSFLIVLPRSAPVTPPNPGDDDGAHLRGRHEVWGVLSLLVLGFLLYCGVAGSAEVSENLLPTVFWLYVWIAVPLSCALLGDWTQAVNPFAFLAKLADSPVARRTILGGEQPLTWPEWLAWWPAVVLFLLGALGELVYNLTTTVPENAALALICYAGLSTLAGFLYGEQWLRRGEIFTVLFDTWGRLGFFRFGASGRRGFGGGFARPFAARVSRVAFVLLLLLNVNFDGLLSTPQWSHLTRDLPHSLNASQSRVHGFDSVAFLVGALALATLFGAFALATARAGRHGTSIVESLTGLLPSLLPIAFAYLLAHNLEYLLVNGQLLLPLIGNPTGLESWPLHLHYPFNDDYEVHHAFLPSAFYWYVSVVVIVAAHVYAVVLAHRHLVATASTERDQRRSEFPWLVAMVGYTMLSLWLLAQPLVRETATTSGEDEARGAACVILCDAIGVRSAQWLS